MSIRRDDAFTGERLFERARLNVDKDFIIDDWAVDADDAGVETEVFDESTRLVNLWELGKGSRRGMKKEVSRLTLPTLIWRYRT